MRTLVYAGQDWPVEADTVVPPAPDWPLARPTDPGFRERTRTIDTAVWHWTAAENSAPAVRRNMAARKLGVEFIINPDGAIWQTCDPAECWAAHCGRFWGPRSVGVEVVNAAGPVLTPRGKSLGREVEEWKWRGRTVAAAGFTAAQNRAALALADWCEDVLGIPCRVQTNGWPMSPSSRKAWPSGHLGHCHISTTGKLDPGIPFLRRLDGGRR